MVRKKKRISVQIMEIADKTISILDKKRKGNNKNRPAKTVNVDPYPKKIFKKNRSSVLKIENSGRNAGHF